MAVPAEEGLFISIIIGLLALTALLALFAQGEPAYAGTKDEN